MLASHPLADCLLLEPALELDAAEVDVVVVRNRCAEPVTIDAPYVRRPIAGLDIGEGGTWPAVLDVISVGLDLDARGELLGRLDDLQAMAGGHRSNLVIRRFEFWLDADHPLTLNEEVAKALWAPLAPLADGRADTVRPYSFEGRTLSLPAFQVGPHVVKPAQPFPSIGSGMDLGACPGKDDL